MPGNQQNSIYGLWGCSGGREAGNFKGFSGTSQKLASLQTVSNQEFVLIFLSSPFLLGGVGPDIWASHIRHLTNCLSVTSDRVHVSYTLAADLKTLFEACAEQNLHNESTLCLS